MTGPVDAYIDAQPAAFARALQHLRTRLAARLTGHIECISHAMPGFRQPGPKGKMVVGYAAFARHLGLYPHSGTVIPTLQAQCQGFKTSRSGLLFTPDHPIPDPLLDLILAARLSELSAGYGRKT